MRRDIKVLVTKTRYTVWLFFLLDCREDEDKPSKVASQSVIEMAASFTDGATLIEI